MLRLILLAVTMGIAACHAPEQRFASSGCSPVVCSSLLPAPALDDVRVNDCAYRAGNQWWLDYVAGTLAWRPQPPPNPVTVALFDDGAETDHVELRDQLWANSQERSGRSGVDDDGNGFVDDVHGWDFVEDDGNVAAEGECAGRSQHGTFMASLIAARRNNAVGIAAAGADGARLMVLRVTGCSRDERDRADPARLVRALRYATGMGARILSFSAHWNETSPELDAAFAEIADERESPRAAIVVASVPNKGEPAAGYPAAYTFRRIIRAIPIGNDDAISPGVSPVAAGLNLGAPSACVVGASAGANRFGITHGSSNSAAILSGLLAGIWAQPQYAAWTPDEFVSRVVEARMVRSTRRSRPGSRPPYEQGVALADACMLATHDRAARVCAKRAGMPIMSP